MYLSGYSRQFTLALNTLIYDARKKKKLKD